MMLSLEKLPNYFLITKCTKDSDINILKLRALRVLRGEISFIFASFALIVVKYFFACGSAAS
jgi:hypothetical protein